MWRSVCLAGLVQLVSITGSIAEMLTPPPGHVAYLCKDPQEFPLLFESIKQQKGVPGLRCHKIFEGTDLLVIEKMGDLVLVRPNPFGDFTEGNYWTYIQFTVPKETKPAQ